MPNRDDLLADAAHDGPTLYCAACGKPCESADDGNPFPPKSRLGRQWSLAFGPTKGPAVSDCCGAELHENAND